MNVRCSPSGEVGDVDLGLAEDLDLVLLDRLAVEAGQRLVDRLVEHDRRGRSAGRCTRGGTLPLRNPGIDTWPPIFL